MENKLCAIFGFAVLVIAVQAARIPIEENIDDKEHNVALPRGKTFYEVRVAQGHIIMREQVEVDTIKNYVVVHAPGMGDYKKITVFHDYDRNTTLFVYPESGHCYLMDHYSDIPKDMSYWFNMKESTRQVNAFDGNNMGRYKTHLYEIVEVNMDKSVLTAKMRQFCTDDMELRRTVMIEEDELSPGSDEPTPTEPYEEEDVIYMPYVPTPGERVKRAAAVVNRQFHTEEAPHECTVRIRLIEIRF